MGFYGPGLSVAGRRDTRPTSSSSIRSETSFRPLPDAEKGLGTTDVVVLQHENAALKAEVARLKGLLVQSCPSDAWIAALISNNSSGCNPGSSTAEPCTCPCHAVAQQFASALVRYKGLIAQLQQQVLSLQAQLSQRTSVVLEADAILSSTAQALAPLTVLLQQPFTAPAKGGSAASRHSRGGGSGGGVLGARRGNPLHQQQQQQQPSPADVCGAELVLEEAAQLRDWCSAMQQRLGSARAAAAALFAGPTLQATCQQPAAAGGAFSSGRPGLQAPQQQQYIPVGGNCFLQPPALPQAPPSSSSSPLRASVRQDSTAQLAGNTSSSSSSWPRCSLTQLCAGQGLSAAEVGQLHALEVQLAALAPRLAAFALLVRVQLLPLLPWLGPAACQQLLEETAALGEAAAAAAVDLGQLSCLLPAGPVKAAAACAGSAKEAAAQLRARQSAGAWSAAAAAAKQDKQGRAGPGVAAARGPADLEQQGDQGASTAAAPPAQQLTAEAADPQLWSHLNQLQHQLTAATAAAAKLEGNSSTSTTSRGGAPSRRLSSSQQEQQQQQQHRLQRALQGCHAALQQLAGCCGRGLWRQQALQQQLRVLAGCSGAVGRLVSGLVQQVAEALAAAAAAAEGPALSACRAAAVAASRRLLRALLLVRERPEDPGALRGLLLVLEGEEQQLQELPELLQGCAAPALQAAALGALRRCFAAYRDSVASQQQDCQRATAYCQQQQQQQRLD